MAITITKKKLKQMYYSKTNEEICKELNISKVTLISYIEKYGIEKKGKGYNKSKLIVK